MANQESIQVFDNEIDMYINLFCEEQGIESLKQESQSVWNGCLMYVYRHLFKGNMEVLKDTPNINNKYNFNILNELCDYYIYLCTIYSKEVSIMGYKNLTGISQDIIYQWGNNNNKYINGRNKLTYDGSEIYKKLNQGREESLSNKLADGKQNPVGVIAILNHHYNWSSPYTSDANKTASQRIARESLKAEIEEKRQSIELPKLSDNLEE